LSKVAVIGGGYVGLTTAACLADLGNDVMVVDIQDIGSRYYTYIWTMMLAMEACASARLRFVVCDRPNPIGGSVEGAPQSTGYLTFVGLHPIPVRHGMTAGELARHRRLAEQVLDRIDRLIVVAVVDPHLGDEDHDECKPRQPK